MKRVLPTFLLASAVSCLLAADKASAPAKTGTIAGTVRFTGKVPAAKTIPVTDGSTIQHSDLLVDAKTQGLRYVVAVLEDAAVQPAVKDAKPVVVDQRAWIFQPRVVAVREGQTVRFENSDQFNHSVMGISLEEANQFNAFAVPGMPVEHAFKVQKGPVMIGCSLHAWMRAWVFVVQHPWFAVTDEKGAFRITDVPPGKYTLVLTHPDSNLRERRTIEVQAGKTLDVAVDWKTLK